MFSLEICLAFFALVVLAILFDLGVTSSVNDKAILNKMAGLMVAGWVMLAILFATFILLYSNLHYATLFFTGYLVELSLSVDNIFIFMLVFSRFKISQKAQHKILNIGILSALILRFLMISAGTYFIQKFEYISYLLGTFLFYSGVKILFKKKQKKINQGDKLLLFLKKFLPITDYNHNEKFIVTINGKRYFTMTLMVLVIIEQVDLFFALDSIPAILAITDDIFIVFTSNIFAMFGMRSMYFFLAEIIKRFIYIKHIISIILCFIGCKMIAALQGYHISIFFSLSFILISVFAAIILSLMKQQHKR